MEYFDIDGSIEITNFKSVQFYDDYWSRCFRRNDVGGGLLTHVNGCRNIDFSIISEFQSFRNKDKKEKETWINNHFGQFPFYYTTPTQREFCVLNGVFRIKLSIDKHLLDLLSKRVLDYNIGYLGSSDGWVDINIEKL
jgi:CRISPR-associated protein Cas5